MRLPAEQRRRQLLDVACDVFAERGFHATSMEEIAIAAGVTKPVLYQHFPSKRALYGELLGDIHTRLLAQLRSATGSAITGRERVEEGFTAYFDFVTKHRSAFKLMFGASARNDAEFAQIVARTIDDVAELVAALIEIEVPDEHRFALAHAVVGMAEATSRRLVEVDADHDPERLAWWLAEMTWFGLRGVRADEPAAEPSGRA